MAADSGCGLMIGLLFRVRIDAVESPHGRDRFYAKEIFGPAAYPAPKGPLERRQLGYF